MRELSGLVPDSGGACIQHASPSSAAIERGCSIGANHAQNMQLTISAVTAYVAITRFVIIRAHFNKHSAQAFPKADYRSSIRNTLIPGLTIEEARLRLPGSGRFG
jgi:hypothetical protein